MKFSYLFILFLTLLFTNCSKDEGNSNSIGDFSSEIGGEFIETPSGDNYNEIIENTFVEVSEQAISTFSIDADGASYANMRRYIQESGQLPPENAIRTEEFINYFNLDYSYKDSLHPINLNGEISECPWNKEHKLIRIGIKAKPISEQERPASNFVFLIDVSGSMGSEDKLDLLKNGFNYFVDGLSDKDKVAIVTYAGSSGLVLEATSGSNKSAIKKAINSLGSGGSTAGAQGIVTAYEIAQNNFIDGGNNRIVIGTDGDFNVGPTSQEELITLIEEKRDLGIFLTVLGVGRGNLNEGTLEQIANNGNGNFEYIDSLEQLKKVFVYDYDKFYTVVKDVKVQVEFNSKVLKSYRLIGYENRILNREDFEDDTKDAGEIGANQSITALFEIIPVINSENKDDIACTVDFRYKNPDSEVSTPMNHKITNDSVAFENSTDFMKFVSSVASFALLIRQSDYKGDSNYESILEWLDSIDLEDQYNFKSEFKSLVEKASSF